MAASPNRVASEYVAIPRNHVPQDRNVLTRLLTILIIAVLSAAGGFSAGWSWRHTDAISPRQVTADTSSPALRSVAVPFQRATNRAEYLLQLSNSLREECQATPCRLKAAADQLDANDVNAAISELTAGSRTLTHPEAVAAMLLSGLGGSSEAAGAFAEAAFHSLPSADTDAAIRIGALLVYQAVSTRSVRSLALGVAQLQRAVDVLPRGSAAQADALLQLIPAQRLLANWQRDIVPLNDALQTLSALMKAMGELDTQTFERLAREQAMVLKAIALRDDTDESESFAAATNRLQDMLASATPVDEVWIHNELGQLQRRHAASANEPERLLSALEHYQKAIDTARETGSSTNVRIISGNGILVLADMARSDMPLPDIAEARALWNQARSGVDPDSQPRLWGELHVSWAEILSQLTQIRGNTLDEIIAAYRTGLATAHKDGRSIESFAIAQNKYADILQVRAERLATPGAVSEALLARRNAWTLYQLSGMAQYEYYFTDRLATLEQLESSLHAIDFE